MPYIELHNCSKIINSYTILNKINLEIERNTITGFVGKNGSGKTMLFKVLSGLVKLSEGELLIHGEKIDNTKVFPQNIGVMIENNGLWPNLSAYDNLSILATIRNILTKEDILQLIKKVGLGEAGKKPFSKYSLGMKQRLVFAQAIMEKPDILILDEPTNALDKDGVALFKSIINEEKSRGATILIASHSLEDFEDFCDDIVQMGDGTAILRKPEADNG